MFRRFIRNLISTLFTVFFWFILILLELFNCCVISFLLFLSSLFVFLNLLFLLYCFKNLVQSEFNNCNEMLNFSILEFLYFFMLKQIHSKLFQLQFLSSWLFFFSIFTSFFWILLSWRFSQIYCLFQKLFWIYNRYAISFRCSCCKCRFTH